MLLPENNGYYFCADLNGTGRFSVDEKILHCRLMRNTSPQRTIVNYITAINIISEKKYKPGKIVNKSILRRVDNLIRFHLNLTEREPDEIKYLTRLDTPGNNLEGKLWQKRI